MENVTFDIRTYDDVPGVRSLRVESDDRLWCAVKDHHGLSLVEAGRSAFWSRAGVVTSGPGAIHLSEPGSVHRELRREGRGRFHIVSFAPGLVRGRRLRTVQLEAGHPDRRAFLALFAALRPGASALARQTAVTEGIAALERQRDAGPRSGALRIDRAVEYIHAHLDHALTLDAIAAAAGVERFRLCRAFRAEHGVPPYTYVLRARITRARELLAAGQPPLDVALAVGFCDQSQLHRHFRRATGLTPGAYARAAR